MPDSSTRKRLAEPARRSFAAVIALWSCFWYAPSAEAHGSLHEQIAALTRRIQESPRDATLYLKRGQLNGYHRDWEGALADYDRAQELDPSLAQVDFARGETLLSAGRYEQARRALDRFLTHQSDHAQALVARARVLVKLDLPRAAVEDYARAIEVSESHGEPRLEQYLERARALTASGDDYVDQALHTLDRGIEKLGPVVTLQLYAVDLELTRKRYDSALTRLDSIATQSPRKELWLVRRARILEQAGRLAEAGQNYELALIAIESLSPRHRRTRATMTLETEVRACLLRLVGNEDKETKP